VNTASTATVASFTAALYFALAIGARAVRWVPVAPHPMLPAAVLVLYLVVTAVATRRAPVARRVAGFVALVLLHAALVGATAYVWTLGTKSTFEATLTDALWALPSVVILQALCVPVLASPLWPIFAQPRVVRRVRPRNRRGPAPLPRAQAVSWPGNAPAAESATAAEMLDTADALESVETVPGAEPEPAVETVAALMAHHVAPSPSPAAALASANAVDHDPHDVPSAAPVASSPRRRASDDDDMARLADARSRRTTGAATPRVDVPAAESPRERTQEDAPVRTEVETPARRTETRTAVPATRPSDASMDTVASYAPLDAGTASLRIPFTAVAEQIPQDVLAASATKVAAGLPEPGYVRVPEALVINQLGEGLVRISWDVIARQLPDAVFAGSRAAAVRRLADLAIELPLADIVSQLSPDVFADTLQPVELSDIEGFPMPFLPTAEMEGAEDTALASASDEVEPEMDEPELAAAEEETPHKLSMRDPDPVPEVAATPSLAIEADVDHEPPTPVLPMPRVEAEPVPVPAARTEHAPVAHEPDDAVASTAPLGDVAVPPRDIRALFARLDRFDIDTDRVDGVTLYRVVGPDLSAEALRDVAANLVTLLRKGWSGRGLDQITVRGATTAVVVTALGDLTGSGGVLVAGTLRGPGLALVELLGRRGAATWPSTPGAGRSVAVLPDEELVEPIDGEDLSRIASVMDAFGPVAGRCFAGDAALVYAFVEPSFEAPDVAQFAREVVDAIAAAGVSGLDPMESVTARSGVEHVVIRPVPRPRGVPRLVVAAGPVERPGLAQRQVERAAALLSSEAV
jgi:hypothetical protein